MNEVFSGTTTDDKDVEQKAWAPIRTNSEFVSNEIDESELQHEKHDEQITWTWQGIVIDLSEKQQ
jgi:hypothetical protein